ncbi:MAG: secretin N-terminal domain-containing protein, partial [Pseudomonadota bacterium]
MFATGSGEALGLGAGSAIKVIADDDNNALLILANAAEYEKIEEAVKKLDVVPRQVLVEVTIAEVTL